MILFTFIKEPDMALSTITDYYSDVSKQLFYKINKNYDTPDFVKTASEETIDDIVNVPVSYFADIARRKLPCHTKSATWLSAAYFAENFDTYTTGERNIVANNLIKSAKLFKINREVATVLMTKAARLERQEDRKYALVIDDNGKDINLFPANSANAIAKSATALISNRAKYSYAMRKEAARNLINAADNYEVSFLPGVEDQLNKSAGFGVSMGAHVEDAIGNRLYLVKHARQNIGCQTLAKVGKMLREEAITLPLLGKVATAIEAFDISNNLTRFYGRIPSPEEICFEMGTTKLASLKVGSVELITGDILSIDKIASISTDDFRDVMGDALTDAITDTANGSYDTAEMADVLPSLPRDAASTLVSLVEG